MNDVLSCPSCGIQVKRIVPFVSIGPAGWYWDFSKESRKELLELWKGK
jgi:predicted nucleic acid-binding Zn ribbon protein